MLIHTLLSIAVSTRSADRIYRSLDASSARGVRLLSFCIYCHGVRVSTAPTWLIRDHGSDHCAAERFDLKMEGLTQVNSTEPGETETVYGDPGTVDFFCNIPDGRRIPAGETFIHTVGTVEYTCKCPANLGPEEQELGQIQIECEQRLGISTHNDPMLGYMSFSSFMVMQTDVLFQMEEMFQKGSHSKHPVGDQRSHCDLPDGRTMPVGQEFDFTQEGLALICTCDTDKSDSIQCRPKGITVFVQILVYIFISPRNHTASSVACHLPDGRSFSVGEKFRYVHEGKRIFCTCEENGDSTMPACINYLQDDEFCFLDDLRDIPRGEHFEYTLTDGMSYNCQCPPAGSADTSISCTQQAFRCSMPDGSTANAGDEKVLEKDGVQYLCKCPLTSPPEGHSIQCSHRKHASFSSH
ncbi:hypothetical protein CAPTEDRAFT_191896 [Capitella teleta]|uniref:Uncharacterized protein n=1 Tax=Capitella teleta TaxID=283909 RepID=R7VJL9_CAPTE|nr:hypothetical protein CAPTEDRAFT_191896 [Capitella teleta]|eukprot:ELU16596.1 hypothetical protein CAPTEDRAFT_191896 [Capitella teleta]